jgi:xanthine dehydrogenase small subunit
METAAVIQVNMSKLRDSIVFYLNYERIEISGDDVFLPLSTWLRVRKNLTGTKIVCSEGDCGACTIILGWMDSNQKLEYRTIDSCIQFLFQLDLCHVITIEGIGSAENLHPAQKAMVDCFGSQCGFCTPGFVMSLAHLAETAEGFGAKEIRQKLAGNLCRCTGYEAIVDAGKTLAKLPSPSLLARFDRNAMETEFRAMKQDSVRVLASDDRVFFKPRDLDEALKLRASMPAMKIIAGGTDVGVQCNKGRLSLKQIMFVAPLAEIGGILEKKNTLEIGAGANWSQISEMTQTKVPALHEIISIFAAEQIRNAATIGGNIINASPIADSIPALFVLGAKLVLQSTKGTREVDIRQFYTGYKKFDMQPDEMLVKIILPLPRSGSRLGLYKVSKRRDLDISTVTLGIYVQMANGLISEVHVAAGGVAATVIRLPSAEKALQGKPMDAATFAMAAKVATAEIKPLSDVRGSADYRRLLIHNLFNKFHYEYQNGAGIGA